MLRTMHGIWRIPRRMLAFMQAHVLQDEKESVFKCSALVKMEKALKLETRGAQGCYSTVTM